MQLQRHEPSDEVGFSAAGSRRIEDCGHRRGDAQKEIVSDEEDGGYITAELTHPPETRSYLHSWYMVSFL